MTNSSNHDDDPPLAVVKSRRRRPSGAMSSSSASVASHGSTRSVTEMAPSLPRTPQMVNRLEDLQLDVPLKQPELDDTISPTETETSNNNKKEQKLPASMPTTLKAATALSRQRLPPSTSLTRNLYYSSSIPSMGSELFHIHEDLEGDDNEEDWSNYDFSACSLTQRQPKIRKQRKQKQHRKMQRFLERETNQSPNRLPNTTILKSHSKEEEEKEEDLNNNKKTTSQEEEESKLPQDSPVNHRAQDIVPLLDTTTTQSIITDDDEESKFHVHNLDYSNAIGRHATHFGSSIAMEEEEGGNISVAFTMDDDSVYVCSFASASIPPELSPQQGQQDAKDQVVCPSIHDEVDVDDYDNDQNLDDNDRDDNGSGTTVDGVAYKDDGDDDSDSDEDDDEDDDYSLFQDMVSVLTTPEDVTSSVSPPISDDATAATDVVELAHQLLREHHRWETQVIHKTHGSSTLVAAPKKRAPFVMVCSATPHEFHGSTRSQIAIQVDSPIARPTTTTTSKHKNAAGGDAFDNKRASSRHDRKQVLGDSQEGGTDSETPTHTSAPPNPNDNNNGAENCQHQTAKKETLPKQGSNRRQSSWKPPAQLPDTPARHSPTSSPTSRPEMTKMDSLRQGLSQLHIVSSARGIQRQSSEKQQQQQEQFPSTTPKKKLSWLKLLLPKALRRKVKSVSVTIFGNYHGHSHNNHNNNNSKKTTRTKHAGKENQNRRNANLSRRATLKTERYESAFWNDPTEFAVAERSATSETHPEEMPTPFVPPPSLLPTGQSTKEIRIGPKEINARPFMDKQVSAYSTEIEC